MVMSFEVHVLLSETREPPHLNLVQPAFQDIQAGGRPGCVTRRTQLSTSVARCGDALLEGCARTCLPAEGAFTSYRTGLFELASRC